MRERLSRRLWVRQLLALVGKEFQQIVRDPSSYLVAGVLPLLFLLLFGYGITLDAGVLQLAVFNQSGGAGHVPVFCHAGAGRGHVTGHRSKADPKAEARDCKARPFDISEPPLPCCGAYAPGMRRTSAPCPQDCRCRIGDGRGGVRHGAPACDHDGG